MIQYEKPIDSIVVGAGILGLWAARHAILQGERVVVVEKRKVGAGASGGFLGALMPHMPDSWNPKKQMQLDGLSTIQDAINLLEKDTGMDCGFRRCGRLMPLTHEKMKTHVELRMKGAAEHWGSPYKLRCMECWKDPLWLNPEIATHGAQYDSLSARVDPRKYLTALAAFVSGRATILEDTEVVGLHPERDSLTLSNGEVMEAGKITVANGWEAYPLLQPYLGPLNENAPIGRGVKGQAVLVELEHDDGMPIIYNDGTYVVPHAGNRVAIGSTSVKDWQDGSYGSPDAFDPDDMGFYHKALELVPSLVGAPIIERWAGVRPRNTLAGRGTEPWFGPVPGHGNLIALIGGFKITFGIAHNCLQVSKSR